MNVKEDIVKTSLIDPDLREMNLWFKTNQPYALMREVYKHLNQIDSRIKHTNMYYFRKQAKKYGCPVFLGYIQYIRNENYKHETDDNLTKLDSHFGKYIKEFEDLQFAIKQGSKQYYETVKRKK